MKIWLLAAAALVSTPALAGPQQAAADSQARACFRSNDFRGFEPLGDRAMIVRAGLSDYFRVDFAGSCPAISSPGATLITEVRGSDMICSGVDWSLKVARGGDPTFATPCIVSGQTRLTKEEAAALREGKKR